MPAAHHLSVIVPGLLGPVTDPDAVAGLLPDLPATAALLARADRLPGPATAETALCRAFGIDGPPWPVAAAARAGEADAAAPGARWWLRVDPVHLRVDTNHARLFGGHVLGLEADEAEALVARLNAHFGADGLTLEAPAPDRWYLALDEAQALEAHAPAEVVGRNVDHFLPTGADAARWRGRLNEIQMLLHDAPPNRAREEHGRLTVNSGWVWGGGYAPRALAAPSRVLAADPLARGLARLAGTEAEPLPASAAALGPGAGHTLVFEPAARDPLVHGEIEAWLEAVQRLERAWLAPLRERLRRRELDALDIVPADGRRFRVTRGGLRRFWRRPRSWTQWLGRES